MSKKIVVVGGVAGGMSFAARCRRLDPTAEIVVFERGRDVSFSNCALPFHLSGIVEEASSLVLVTPETFRLRYNLDVRPRHEVVSIDREAKKVTVRKVDDGTEFEEAYDVLCLSPGANPIIPDIPGKDADNVHVVRNVVDIERLKPACDAADEIAVIGGGFIGLEVMENLRLAGKKVTLVEAADQVMLRLDADIVQLLHREIHDQGVDLVLGDAISGIDGDTITLASGRTVTAQTVVMAIGVTPETTLARAAGLDIGTTGGIKVDHNYLTSDPSIYAVGDAVEEFGRLTGKPMRLALAGPAQRQARAAADHVHGRYNRRTGVLGSSVLQVFDLTAASTGLNEAECAAQGLNFDSIYYINAEKVGLMPTSTPLHLKLIYEVPTGRVLGAQAVGKHGVDKRIDVVAALLMQGITVHDLAELELCYSPLYSTAKDILNMAGLVATNQLNGEIRQVKHRDIRRLIDEGATIIDVREPDEYDLGHIKGALNIPFSQFRDRLDEIPADRPVYLHCRIGHRSYYVTRELNQIGFPEAVNVNGAFLGLSNFEYFHDVVGQRERVVTDYNFS
ncbi:NADPH-dependent 2,4-dienoyl-CoA reductase, sulfur reductase [Austwickia chelonae]|uniref:Pyridine nucleotide-disulphide oxidoreductase family protein n=1 Tax=Austwickia chelonae NBRC 105200 TaxID=1184607 RepID=K6V9X4_9MICO|nr:FAD-dependent oxidoreductase [Austwickia chelonae]GAB79008.1 pyridine nucleotide-disulphide oxidoreductase family protein [Austwickia chelonae NBRC 105200]SEW41616.1 NADPH-dependent 2,4-dienoyl-CoA reductase, sulfur reductase [Austwickia chelonae]